MKIKPLGERVLLKRTKEENMLGGIIIPDASKDKSQKAEVLAIGTGRIDEYGKLVPFNLKVGDIVVIPAYGGALVKIENEEYLLLDDSSVLGVIS